MGIKIQLLGVPAIVDSAGQSRVVRGHQAWALLARVLISPRPLGRRELAVELFPETVDPLGSLRWCLASLRRALNCADALRGDPVAATLPEATEVDVQALENPSFDITAAGDLLEGIDPQCSAEFSTWLLLERERIASLIDARIRQEAQQALAVGDYDRAVRLGELGVRRTPFNEGAHILLVKALTLAGRFDTAREHVESTEQMFMAELGQAPSAALRSASRRSVAAPPSGISARAIVDALMASGLAALSAGAVEAGVDCLRRAASDAEKCGDLQLQAQTLAELGTALVHSVRGYDDEGAILLRQSVELAERCGAARIALTGYRELGYVEALAGRRPTASDHLARALEVATDGDDLASVHSVIGFNLVDWGKLDEGLAHYQTSLEHAYGSGNRRRQIWALGLGAWGLLAADRLADADRWLSDCLTLVDDLRWTSFRPWPSALLVESRLRQGDDPGALQLKLESAFALSCQLGDPCWEGAVARAMGLCFEAMDDHARAMEWLAEGRQRCVRETDSYVALSVEILLDQARVSSKLGQSAQAEACARECLSVAARAHMDAHVRRAILLMN